MGKIIFGGKECKVKSSHINKENMGISIGGKEIKIEYSNFDNNNKYKQKNNEILGENKQIENFDTKNYHEKINTELIIDMDENSENQQKYNQEIIENKEIKDYETYNDDKESDEELIIEIDDSSKTQQKYNEEIIENKETEDCETYNDDKENDEELIIEIDDSSKTQQKDNEEIIESKEIEDCETNNDDKESDEELIIEIDDSSKTQQKHNEEIIESKEIEDYEIDNDEGTTIEIEKYDNKFNTQLIAEKYKLEVVNIEKMQLESTTDDIYFNFIDFDNKKDINRACIIYGENYLEGLYNLNWREGAHKIKIEIRYIDIISSSLWLVVEKLNEVIYIDNHTISNYYNFNNITFNINDINDYINVSGIKINEEDVNINDYNKNCEWYEIKDIETNNKKCGFKLEFDLILPRIKNNLDITSYIKIVFKNLYKLRTF